ncbi:hypothetical protein MBLNU230_g5450t1 [Neophaeotheca triangularis]
MAGLRSLALFALSSGFATLSAAQASGSGSTTRYWDCCKGSCAWPGKADVSSPINTCDANDNILEDANAASGCDGGEAYMCSDQSPWAVSEDLAYGFAAVSIPGGDESFWCCACYELTFTTTSIAGKKMIVQATNTGGDLDGGQFDLAIPGGGVGIFNGCTDQWGAPADGWGERYGGLTTDTCSSLASPLQPGCNFRFGDFFENADNPDVEYRQVTCPKALTDKSGCIRAGETPTESEDAEANPSPSNDEASVETTAAAEIPSSTEVAPVEPSAPAETPSAESPPVESTPAAEPSTTEAAPVESTEPADVPPTDETPAETTEAASSASSYAPVYGTGSSPAVPVGTGNAPPAEYPPNNENAGECEVQYVYEDEI